jgi:hypothetical protein
MNITRFSPSERQKNQQTIPTPSTPISHPNVKEIKKRTLLNPDITAWTQSTQ